MDHGQRLAKVERAVEENQDRMDRFDIRFDRLDDSIAELREHTDHGLAALREHTDQGLASLREHADQGLASLREHTDQGLIALLKHTDAAFAEQRADTDRALAEIRQELLRTTRWLIGLALGYGAALLGMLGRMGGLY